MTDDTTATEAPQRKIYTADEIRAILDAHSLWLRTLWVSAAAERRGTRAVLRGAVLTRVPVVPNIDAAILAAIGDVPARLEMSQWHGESEACGTTHCRAGWAITLAGDEGAALERKLRPATAGALIYAASGSFPVPNFYADNETALADLRARATAASAE